MRLELPAHPFSFLHSPPPSTVIPSLWRLGLDRVRSGDLKWQPELLARAGSCVRTWIVPDEQPSGRLIRLITLANVLSFDVGQVHHASIVRIPPCFATRPRSLRCCLTRSKDPRLGHTYLCIRRTYIFLSLLLAVSIGASRSAQIAGLSVPSARRQIYLVCAMMARRG